MNRPHHTISYLPGLDGLRAIAVLAVIVYHANKSWLPGGFLGVEVFFVISGYLITLLLINESQQQGRISFKRFWIRRARRLLPAMWTLLLGVTMYASLFEREELGKLRGDVIAAFVYVFNWFKIWSGSSYFDASALDPLRHLWSLAVEEQFYLVWPLLIALVMKRFGRRPAKLGIIFLGISIAISLYVATSYAAGVRGTPIETPEQYISLFGHAVSRLDFLFLGTLGRSGGLFMGAALAFWYRPDMFASTAKSSDRHVVSVFGVAGIAGLAYLMWVFRDVITIPETGDVRGYDPLFQGGFLLVGVASVAVITAAVHPHSFIGNKVLGNPVFTYLGRRSYGLYLYHWPVYQLYRKVSSNYLSLAQFVVLSLIVLALTEISYRFIEMPIRQGQFGEWWHKLRYPRTDADTERRTKFFALGAVAAVLPVFSVVSLALGTGEGKIAESIKRNEGVVQNLLGTTVPPDPSATTLPATQTTTLDGQVIPILAIGDSVMLGAANILTERGITVDALKSRPFRQALEILNYVKSIGRLGEFVIIHLGTNGPVDQATLDEIMVPLKDVDIVLMVTAHVPTRKWQDSNNELIRAMPNAYGNVRVLDWFKVAEAHPEYLYGDKVHLNNQGRRTYADLIMQAIGK
ncbi:MAG: acyltransferase family protein [Actinobacteria bacterium]|nr:acyltransferase family protein [Actinomycetota bacterium]MDA2951829.1 acyltransferase family protein [Actinomycetota bacterium]